MIDEAESFVSAAKLLKDRGAYKILVMVTHGLLSADAPELIEESVIDEVWYTSSVSYHFKYPQLQSLKSNNLCYLD